MMQSLTQKMTIIQLVKKFQASMEPESSLPCYLLKSKYYPQHLILRHTYNFCHTDLRHYYFEIHND
jgi:hypothetical protein